MKLVIFDFDGVIVNTFNLAYEINKLITPDITQDEYRAYFTGNFYAAKPKVSTAEPDTKIDFFNEYSKRIKTEETSAEMKQQIIELSKKYTLAIVSSTISSIIQNYLTKEDLTEYFSEIYGSDVHTSKVEKIKRLLNEYNIDSKEAVFITDTTGDIKEGRACGVESIAVTWGYLPKEELAKENPFAVIDSPSLIASAVNDYFN